MKTFLISLLLLAVYSIIDAQPKEIPNEVKQIIESCMQENGVTDEEARDFRDGKTQLEDVKDNMKCTAQCILVKHDFMDDDGNFQKDEIIEYFKSTPMKADIEKLVERCGDIKGDNGCDTAFKLMQCMKLS